LSAGKGGAGGHAGKKGAPPGGGGGRAGPVFNSAGDWCGLPGLLWAQDTEGRRVRFKLNPHAPVGFAGFSDRGGNAEPGFTTYTRSSRPAFFQKNPGGGKRWGR